MSAATSNKSSNGAARVIGRPFVKGQSGNPSGRAKNPLDLVELAKSHTVEAIEALVLALRSPRERVPAAIALLDRGWGKPAQMISGDSNKPLVVDFRWADNSSAAVIDSVATQINEQLSVTWEDDTTQHLVSGDDQTK